MISLEDEEEWSRSKEQHEKIQKNVEKGRKDQRGDTIKSLRKAF